MYADISSTGFNLMDLSSCEIILIRDSLIRAGHTPELDREMRLNIQRIIKEINMTVLPAKQRPQTTQP